MNWRGKAAIQRWIAKLPSVLSGPLYYFMQRRFGALRRPEPWTRFDNGIEACRYYEKHSGPFAGARVLEVGTGWRINAPLAFYLWGADEIVSVNLNRFLKPDLVLQDLQIMAADADRVRASIPAERWQADRWATLVALSQKQRLDLPTLTRELKPASPFRACTPEEATAKHSWIVASKSNQTTES